MLIVACLLTFIFPELPGKDIGKKQHLTQQNKYVWISTIKHLSGWKRDVEAPSSGGFKGAALSIQNQLKDTTIIQVIIFNDNHYEVGRILQAGTDTIILLSYSDTIKIATKEIKEIQNINSSRILYLKNRFFFWRSDENTRLFIAPTGYTLHKKEVILSDYLFIFPYLSYGVTERITLGGGLTLFPTSDSLRPFMPLYYMGPKFKLWSSDIFSTSAGIFMFKLYDDSIKKYLPATGIYYISNSFKVNRFNLSLSVGNLFIGKWIFPYPILMLAWHYQLTEKIAVISENIWIWHPSMSIFGSFGAMQGRRNVFDLEKNTSLPDIISFGGRYYKKYYSIGTALVFNISSTSINGIPFIDFIYYF